MANRFENKDSFAPDFISKTTNDVKELIKEMNLFEDTLIKVAQTQKKVVTDRSSKRTVEGIRKQRVAQEALNDVNRVAQKVAKQKQNLTDKLTIANSKQGKVLAELNLQNREQLRTNKQLVNENKKLVGAYAATKNKAARLTKEYRDLVVQQGFGAKGAAELRTEIVRLNAILARTNKATKVATNGMTRMQLGMVKMKSLLKSGLGFIGITGLIFGLARAFGDAFRRIREFDKEMNNLAGIAGTTRKDLGATEKVIKDVAGSSVKTSNEVAKLATTLTALGKSQRDVQKLLKPTNDLGIALNASSDEAGELLVSTLNAFGKGSEAADEFADTIAKFRTSTALDFERIKDSLGFLAPTAKAVNLTLGETGALVGVLQDNGVKAARAGRLLNTSFLRLAEKGLTLEQALRKINASQDKLVTSGELFGGQAATIGLILAEQTEKTAELANEFDNLSEGALKQLTDEQLKSMDAQLKILDSTWEKFILNIEDGEGVLSDLFTSSIRGATGFIDRLDMMSVSLGKLIKRTVGARQQFLTMFETISGIDFIGKEMERVEEQVDKTTDKIAEDFITKDKKTQETIVRNLLKRIKIDQENIKKSTGFEQIRFEQRFKANILLLNKLRDITAQRKEEEEVVGSIGKKTETLIGLITLQAEKVKDLNEEIVRATSEERILEFSLQLDVEQKELERLKRIVSSTIEEINKIEIDLIKDQTEKRIEQEVVKSDKIIQQIITNSRIQEAKKKELIAAEDERLSAFILEQQIKEQKANIKRAADFQKAEFEQRRTGFKTEEAFEKEKAEQFKAIKKNQLQAELDLLEFFDREEDKLRQEQLKAQLEGLEDLGDGAKKMEGVFTGALEVIAELVDEAFSRRIEVLGDTIDNTSKRIDQLREKANQGQLASQESIAFEQKQEVELERERERARKRQERAQAFFSVLTAFNKNDGDLGKTISDVSVLKTLASQLTGFFEGADDVGKDLGKPQLSGKDGHIVRVDGKEQVWSGKDRKAVNFRSRDDIKRIVKMHDSGLINDIYRNDTSADNLSSTLMGIPSNKEVVNGLARVDKSIQSIKIPESALTIDEARKILKFATKVGNRVKIEKSKLHS